MQTLQSHAPSGFLNLSPKPRVPDVVEVEVVVVAEEGEQIVEDKSEAGGRVRAGFTPVPGFAVSHATHLTTSGLFCTKQVSHSQVPGGGANKVLRLAAGAFAGLLSNLEEDSVLGRGAWQATHTLSDGLFCTKHTSQFHDPGAGLNLSANAERGAEDARSLATRKIVSGTEELWAGEANPGKKHKLTFK